MDDNDLTVHLIYLSSVISGVAGFIVGLLTAWIIEVTR